MTALLPTYEALRHSGVEPECHPNGFVVVPLREDQTRRLHVFHPECPRQEELSPIHDHTFDMRSTVLCGRLHHDVMDVHDAFDGGYEVHQARHIKCEETNLFPIGQRVSLRHRHTLTLERGDSYTFPAFEFHQTRSYMLTATIMEKVRKRVGTARVLVPVGVEPDNAFSRLEQDDELLWRLVEEGLNAVYHRRLMAA